MDWIFAGSEHIGGVLDGANDDHRLIVLNRNDVIVTLCFSKQFGQPSNEQYRSHNRII